MLSAFSGNAMIGTDINFDYMNIEHHGITGDLLGAFIYSGFVPTITKPTPITYNKGTLINNIYVKMRQPEELVSAILIVDISDHLPIFTFWRPIGQSVGRSVGRSVSG
ncbi:hypothetical protein LSH36_1367g00017 [Paralvinella palmiformis]|uniref:Endonuclease/exonuclease/phosphatase domain-containing protein n=1 Tax=Paralvinella palmiformis TaxID=53620 RepID=A0AAD9IUM8_9ANNE|nr:hypothetical protein LSH36_1367g00017 [Paralvinella palmiformis]